MITQGIYEHYKSTPEHQMLYQVLFLSRSEESLEILVNYIPLYHKEDSLGLSDGVAAWTRTLANFTEEVEYNGKTMQRFTLLQSIVEE